MKRKVTSFGINPKVYEQLMYAAKKEHRSVGNLIEVIIMDYLKVKYNIDLGDIV